MNDNYQKVLEKARIKYRDAVRGFEYQEQILRDGLISTASDYEYIAKRRDIFKAEFTVLEDVFGVSILNGDKDEKNN